MYLYTVQFEYRKADEAEFHQHQGGFIAPEPAGARDKVLNQLRKLGFVVGTYAVFGSGRLLLGSLLPKPFPVNIARERCATAKSAVLQRCDIAIGARCVEQVHG